MGDAKNGCLSSLRMEELVWKTFIKCLDMVPTCLLWLIWREHNTCIFEDTDRPVDSLMSMLDV